LLKQEKLRNIMEAVKQGLRLWMGLAYPLERENLLRSWAHQEVEKLLCSICLAAWTFLTAEVIIDGKRLNDFSDDELTVFRRRKIGFIFQQYNLLPMLNVWENIILPVKMDGVKADRKYLGEVTSMLGLADKQERLPEELSGGQQQRVAIARALAAKPAIVLADEPTGNLDSRTSQDVLGLLKITGEKYSQTILMITHNEEIAQLADRIVRIEDGKIVGR